MGGGSAKGVGEGAGSACAPALRRARRRKGEFTGHGARRAGNRGRRHQGPPPPAPSLLQRQRCIRSDSPPPPPPPPQQQQQQQQEEEEEEEEDGRRQRKPPAPPRPESLPPIATHTRNAVSASGHIECAAAISGRAAAHRARRRCPDSRRGVPPALGGRGLSGLSEEYV